MNDIQIDIPSDYPGFLEDLKNRIRTAQVKAVVAVNSELVMLYWNIGKQILAAQQTKDWGCQGSRSNIY